MKCFIIIFLLFFFPLKANYKQIEKETNLFLVGQMELYITDQGFFVVKYNGIVSSCFTKQYFDFYFNCDKFNTQEYLNELKEQLKDTIIIPDTIYKKTKQIYRI